jgi:predicted ATPase
MEGVVQGSPRTTVRPFINRIELIDFPPIDLLPGSIVFVVGPNNGGKSTFLNEIASRVGHASDTKWISKLNWNLGSQEEYLEYVSENFSRAADDNHLKDRFTGNKVNKHDIVNFFSQQKTHYGSFLIRPLNAQNRIDLANRTSGPNVIDKIQVHPYHRFFFDLEAEEFFSNKIKAAFDKYFRINRTGVEVVGHLGDAPHGERLSLEYESDILNTMRPIDQFGDGVRSYTGILLNSVSDVRPVTIIDEPEAFLHPPQARRLGQEISLAAKEHGRQAFIATHSSDFIQGALSAKNPNTYFLYLDHSNTARPIYSVNREIVDDFSRKPFLNHTNALDALFYEQAIICEGEADIMFFKWALEDTTVGKKLDESFWVSSYGKSAVPGILSDLLKLGVKASCVFDLDVLLSPDILTKVCDALGVNFSPYQNTLREVAKAIRVPPAADALHKIESIISQLDDSGEDEASRIEAIRAIKRSAEGLGKSWTLKTNGLSAIPKGALYSSTLEFLEIMRCNRVIILEEGEIENYNPTVGGHGQAWVRAALEAGAGGE